MPPGIIGPNGGLYNSSSSVQVSENTTFVFDFDSNEAVTWGISGGQDLLRFSINSSTGALAFNSAPDYENPSDYPDGGAPNNNYVVTISATSSSGSTSYHTVVVQVQDVNESGAGTGSAGSSGSGSSGSGSPPPGIIGPDGGLYNSSSTIQASENTTTVFDFNSNQEVAWAVSGGQDGHLFSIASSTGVLSFKNAPDYENPTDYPDSGASDNNYVVTISATNSSGSVSYHTIAVQVQNVTDSSDGSSGSSGSGSGSSGSIPPVTDVSPTTPAETPATPTTTPVTPTPTQESPVLGIQPQETVTTVELSTPIVLGNLEVTKAVVGTDSRDVVTGSDEGEALAGGKGKDQMTGGGGSDAFVFETPGEFGRQSADVITDLNSDQGDKIVIASDAFKGVSKIKFTSVTGKGNAKDAASSNKTFVYDDKTGMLYFNENGRKDGFGDGGEFVKLVGAPELGKSDIVII